MSTLNHPDEERLAALAGADADATSDRELSEHVGACRSCAETVADLRAMRAALAELPDLRPHRPLQLLPPVEPAPPSAADRLAGLVRRAFMPALTAGAALALVGTVGTVAPNLAGSGSSAGGGDDAAVPEAAFDQSGSSPSVVSAGEPEDRLLHASPEYGTDEGEAQEGASAGSFAAVPADGASPQGAATDAPEGEASQDAPIHALETPEEEAADRSDSGGDGAERRDRDAALQGGPLERSPWPMVLFSGIALIVGTVLLRWILVPRAG